MATRPDIDQLVVAWLSDEAASTSDLYLDETLGLLERTPQRRWQGALRRAIPLGRPVVPVRRAWLQIGVVALLGLALIAAALIVGARPRPAPPLGLAANGRIAFANGLDALILDPFADGERAVSLAGGMGSEGNPEFSPDGTLIAYFSRDPAFGQSGGPVHLFVAPADGSEVGRPVSGGIVMWDNANVSPKWSPDSTRITYHGYEIRTQTSGIAVARVDGSEATMLVAGGDQFLFGGPVWSPDGQWIAYRDMSYEFPDGTALKVVASGGGEPRVVTFTPGKSDSYTDLSWSPDSRQLAYVRRLSEEPGDASVAILDVSTGSERVLTDGDVRSDYPAWSPDGKRLAYFLGTMTTRGLIGVVIVDLATGSQIELGAVLDCEVHWSPDGEYLLGYAPGCRDALVVVPVDDPKAARTIDVPGISGALSWQRLAP
jgi:hypothetical protein